MSSTSTDSRLAEIDPTIDFRPHSGIHFKNIEYRNVATKEVVMRIWPLLRGWLNNLSVRLEKHFQQMDDDLKKMSSEDREMYLRYVTEYQLGKDFNSLF